MCDASGGLDPTLVSWLADVDTNFYVAPSEPRKKPPRYG
jgi:hypothetical protein